MRFLFVLFVATTSFAADRCRAPAPIAIPADPRLLSYLADHPGDLWAHRAYLDSSVYHRKPVRDRYAELVRLHPGNLDYAYLAARSLVGSDTREALKRFNEILALEPNHPWVHLVLLEVYRSDGFKDLKALKTSFEAVTLACPDQLEPYRYLGHVQDSEAASAAAVKLRQLLARSTAPGDLRLYSALWAAEFRVTPQHRHEELRKQVAADLERLREYSAAGDPEIRRAIQSGARLIGDKKLEESARNLEPRDEYWDWMKSHPRPGTGAGQADLEKWARELLAESARWRERAPAGITGYIERLNALVLLPRSTETEIEAAAEAVLERERRDPYWQPFWPASHRVARAFVDRGIFLDRVPALIQRSVELLEMPEQVIEIDLFPSTFSGRNRMILVNATVQAWQTLAGAHLKQSDPAAAHQVLRRMEDYLTAKRPAAGTTDTGVLQYYASGQWTLYTTKAQVAEHERRKLDALVYYRQAQDVMGGRNPFASSAQSRIWKELGGTPEAWQSWMALASPATAASTKPAWTRPNRALPPFRLRDVEGREHASFLQGRAVVVLWATWCSPCREELPYVQKLFESTRGATDLRVLTFNVDENPGVVEPFLKENSYTFPVLLAKHYVDQVVDALTIPRTWIVDEKGLLLKEAIGFSPTNTWVEETLKEARAR